MRYIEEAVENMVRYEPLSIGLVFGPKHVVAPNFIKVLQKLQFVLIKHSTDRQADKVRYNRKWVYLKFFQVLYTYEQGVIFSYIEELVENVIRYEPLSIVDQTRRCIEFHQNISKIMRNTLQVRTY